MEIKIYFFYLHPLAVEKKRGRPIDTSSRLREREKEKDIRRVVKFRSDFNLLPLAAQCRISSAGVATFFGSSPFQGR